MLVASDWAGASADALTGGLEAISVFSGCLRPNDTRRFIGGLPGGVEDGTSEDFYVRSCSITNRSMQAYMVRELALSVFS